MKKLLCLLFIFYFIFSYSKENKYWKAQASTQEILSILNIYGIDSALNKCSDIPIYRIDTSLALKLSYACNIVTPYNKQVYYLKEIGPHIIDEKLNNILLQNLKNYRSIFDTEMRYGKIEKNIVWGIVFQNFQNSIPLLKNEFIFWKNARDSILNNFIDTIKTFSVKKYNISISQDNFRMLAWALFKLGSNDFSNEYLDSLCNGNPCIYIDSSMYRKMNGEGATWDTVHLSRNYSSLKELDFTKELSLIKRYSYFIQHDSTYHKRSWENLIYNSDIGILDFGFIHRNSSRNLESGVQSKHEFILLSPNKLLVRFINGGNFN